MIIEKTWAMPNGNTFIIKPIKEFVEKEVNKGGVIVDPFLGSGTTALACKYEGIDCVGIELDNSYVEIAKERINNYEKC